MVTFADALGGQLRDKPRKSIWDRRLLMILDAKPSKRRTRILDRLESHARIHLGVGEKAAIDWGSIDWAKLLDFLMKLFVLLAPLFL